MTAQEIHDIGVKEVARIKSEMMVVIEESGFNGSFEEFFAQDGTVEYFNDSLVVLSASVINVKSLAKEYLDSLNKTTQDTLEGKDISDHDRYILNHKLNAIKEIRI